MFEGKTLFQYYALVCLLQQKQVILLLSLDGQWLYLFYYNSVHTTLVDEVQGLNLPDCKMLSSKVFIWSLFDIQEQNELKRLLTCPPCLPVQTAPLDLCQYKIWDKELSPLLTGLLL